MSVDTYLIQIQSTKAFDSGYRKCQIRLKSCIFDRKFALAFRLRQYFLPEPVPRCHRKSHPFSTEPLPRTSPHNRGSSPTLPEAKKLWLHNQEKIPWLLKQEKLRAVLFEGYTGDLNIVYVDQVRAYGNMNTLSFTLYGGSMCSPTMPCVVSLEHKVETGRAQWFEVTITRLKETLIFTKLP